MFKIRRERNNALIILNLGAINHSSYLEGDRLMPLHCFMCSNL